MFVEGKGYVAPSPIGYPVSHGARREFLDRAIRQACARRYEEGKGKNPEWEKGFLEWVEEAIEDPDPREYPLLAGWTPSTEVPPEPRPRPVNAAASIYWGFFGQYAVQQGLVSAFPRYKTKVGVDLEPREYGDGGVDMVFMGRQIEIKTHTFEPPYALIKSIHEDGTECPLRSRIVVWCRVRPKVDPGFVTITGWLFDEKVKSYKDVPAWRGKHLNKQIHHGHLSPFSQLVSYFDGVKISRKRSGLCLA